MILSEELDSLCLTLCETVNFHPFPSFPSQLTIFFNNALNMPYPILCLLRNLVASLYSMCVLTHEEEEQGHLHYDEAVLLMKFRWAIGILDHGLVCHPFNVDSIVEVRPESTRGTWLNLCDDLENGALKPFIPLPHF